MICPLYPSCFNLLLPSCSDISLNGIEKNKRVQRISFFLLSAITLDNTLVILSTVAPDAGRYYVQAVNDKNGENKTSQPITLSVESE